MQVVTTWRSGSTFLGDILTSHPATFYHYEPLIHLGITQVRSGKLAETALKALKSQLNCSYNGLGKYRVEQKTLLSSVKHVPSGLMGCALPALD